MFFSSGDKSTVITLFSAPDKLPLAARFKLQHVSVPGVTETLEEQCLIPMPLSGGLAAGSIDQALSIQWRSWSHLFGFSLNFKFSEPAGFTSLFEFNCYP